MSSNAQHLADHVLRRRTELDMSQIDVWQIGGPSNTTLTQVEGGRMDKLTPVTARKLDAGLLWEQGSARRVWEGGEPVALGSHGRRDEQWLRERIDEAEISAAVRRRLLAALDDAEGRGVS